MATMTNMASSSPHSSDGVTHQETPSTNLSAQSPETDGTVITPAGNQPKFKLRVTIDGPPPTKQPVATTSDDDVFLNEPTSATTQLSPVAESFTPGQFPTPLANTARAGPGYMAGGGGRAGPGYVGNAASVSNLLPGSVPDNFNFQNHMGHLFAVSNQPPNFAPRGTLPPRRPMDVIEREANGMIGRMNDLAMGRAIPFLLRDVNLHVSEGSFSTDEHRGRAVLVSRVAADTPELTVRSIFNHQKFSSITGIILKDLKKHGVVMVGFSNIRDAAEVEPYIRNVHPHWTVRRISPRQYAHQALGKSVTATSDYEGQLIVTLFYDGNDPHLYAVTVVGELKHTLSTFGEIKAFHTLPQSQQHARDFRVEFEDTRSAENALVSLHLATVDDGILHIEHYQPDLVPRTEMPEMPAGPLPGAELAASVSRERQVLSVTGRSLVPMTPQPYSQTRANMNADRNLYSLAPHRGGNDRYDINGNHNQVIIPKIEVGLDVRTTIMLRNIPNKVDSAMLKEILDETSHGAYDFMYLRIDFANNCNVGYAFINFVDALAIIPFAVARAGQRWNKFGSDKVAEISYATIQGKDCLVQKFRNSSVMLEDPSFRPKLFATGTGPGAGEEEPFPGPDNVSKMRRSVENAEHVGLFVPTTIDAPPAHIHVPPRTLAPTPTPHVRSRHGRAGTYMAPARVAMPSAPMETPVHRLPPFSNHIPAPAHRSAQPIMTPSTSTESLDIQQHPYSAPSSSARVGIVDVGQADDPFVGTSTSLRNTAPNIQPQRLFAPRQGQAYREEQRRRRSQFDRGTPGAEYEAYSYRLTDPALSPVHSAYTPRPIGHGNRVDCYYPAYAGMSASRPGYDGTEHLSRF